jgi:hypothetical protein
MKKIGTIGLLFFFLMAVPAFAADKASPTPTGLGLFSSVLEPVQMSLGKLAGYLPKVGGLLLILVIGALIAVGIAVLVEKLLEIIRLEKGAKKVKIPEILKKGGIGLSLSELITEVVFFLVIIGTLITALEYYGVGTGTLMGQVLAYIPHVIAAVFILILGIFLAILIGGIIALIGGNVRIAQATTLGHIAKYVIIIVAGLLALKELGLNVILTDNSKDIILGSIALGAAVAFGLGGKDRAEKFLNTIFKK